MECHNDEASNLCDDVGGCGIQWGEDAACLVSHWLQTHRRKLLGDLGNQSKAIGQEDNQGVAIHVPAGWSTCPHVQKGPNLADREHGILAQIFLAPQSPDLNPLDYSIWWQVESKACAKCHSNVEELIASVSNQWRSMRKDYIMNFCKAFRP